MEVKVEALDVPANWYPDFSDAEEESEEVDEFEQQQELLQIHLQTAPGVWNQLLVLNAPGSAPEFPVLAESAQALPCTRC